MACLSGTRGLWQPSGCSGRGGSSGSIFAHNSSGSLQPSSFFTTPMRLSSCSSNAGGLLFSSLPNQVLRAMVPSTTPSSFLFIASLLSGGNSAEDASRSLVRNTSKVRLV